ncbi:MAG TPA: enoyl-CoA hydratase-related protein, partial [Candidatus Limnocylindria bacterium]
MTTPLRVERDGAVAVLTLDRPEVLNAFDETLTAALAAAVTDVARDATVRCVVITGAGRAFSAGQDLHDRAAALAGGPELRLGDE